MVTRPPKQPRASGMGVAQTQLNAPAAFLRGVPGPGRARYGLDEQMFGAIQQVQAGFLSN